MDSIKWESTIKMNIFTLKVVGLWPKSGEVYKFNLYTIYMLICVGFFILFSVFCQVMHVVLVHTDLEALSEPMYISLTKTLASMKAFYLMISLKKIKKFMRTLNGHFLQLKNHQRGTIEPSLLIWKGTCLSFWILTLGTISLWCVFPILDESVKQSRLPFPAWYPYNTKETPFYEITYVHQVIGVFCTATADLSMDTLIAAFMMFIGAQCDILCNKLRNMEAKNFKERFVECIEHHKAIVRFSSLIVLGEFFTSSVTIGLAMFRLSTVSSGVKIATFVTNVVLLQGCSVERRKLLYFGFLGLWSQADDRRTPNLYTLYTVIAVIFFLYGSVFFQILYIPLIVTDLEALTKLMFNLITKSLVCVKAFCLMQNAKTVQRLVKALDSDLFQVKTVDHRKLVQPALLIWKTTYIIFLSLATSTIFMWCILPFVNKSFQDYQLPFLALYPYNFKKSPLYEITYIHQVVGLVITATIDTNLDTLISALMMFIGAQCDILCYNLRNLHRKKFSELMRVCIQHHQEILRYQILMLKYLLQICKLFSFAAKSNHFFNIIVLGQFFATAVSMATGMFRLSMVSPLSGEGYSLLTFVTSMVLQVFLYCWFGNEVEIK
ncbi:7tm 6 domain containing protein, partial [Asbolus verrucosus]